MSKDFLNFPDTDILLFQEPLKDSKLPLELELFPDDPCSIGICDDPFSYRDDSLSSPSYCGTPESSLNLPGSTGTSPDRRFNTTPNTPDSGNLSDIPSLDPIDEFSDLKFAMTPSDKDSDCYEEDLDFRAPFISMNMDDDFPLISPSSSVMWGPQEHLPKKSPAEKTPDPDPPRLSPKHHQPLASPEGPPSLQSSLAALLQSDLKQKQQQHCPKGRKPRRPPPRVIMLDGVPPKQQQQHRQRPRSHTATVKVHDRLIKVQVSVSELPTTPIEQKQPFPSPPDPPPKRSATGVHSDSPKRIKMDAGGIVCAAGTQGLARDSVLLNLLISGEDASRGYLCSGNNRYTENKLEPALLSLPSNESSCSQSESDLLDNFLRLSQYDAADTPLQADDLLSALDHHPLLRNNHVLV